ncbi:MAG TPA: hypothetical protein VNO31_11595, partial [Umezawaea sp.]|nr:hypothetical protein [Umezawaea sp.]
LQGTTEVGKLVDGAPQTKKKTTEPKPTEASAAPGVPNDSAAGKRQDAKSPMEAAFGNVGLPITAVAALGVLLGLVMYVRGLRAKKARARRNAEQEAKLAQLGL